MHARHFSNAAEMSVLFKVANKFLSLSFSQFGSTAEVSGQFGSVPNCIATEVS